jgi:hypothetical protein
MDLSLQKEELFEQKYKFKELVEEFEEDQREHKANKEREDKQAI